MKKYRFPFLLSFGALLVLAPVQKLSAANYQYNRSDSGDAAWDSKNTSNWNSEPPYDGMPTGDGPTAGDDLDLAATGGGHLQLKSAASFIRHLSASLAGQGLLGYTNGNAYTLSIGGDLEVDAGAGLDLYNGGSSRTVSVSVAGDVQVGEGATLYLGRSQADATNQTARIEGFSVAGKTSVSGRLASHLGNATASVNLGDLELGTNGSLVMAARGAATSTGNFTRGLTVRSLSGEGVVYASDVTQAGTRAMTLTIATEASTDATFSGVLADSLVTTAGTNRLHLAVSGAGRQVLSGDHVYTGSTTVSGDATLVVNGSIESSSGVELGSGAILAGHGTVSTISGEGTVALSAQATPGILTANAVNGASGLDFQFRMTTPELEGNDLLRLTDATPFVLALGSGNRVTIDFTGVELMAGDQFFGGFYVDSSSFDLLEAINGAEFQFLGLNDFTISISTLAHGVDFGEGVVNGSITTFTVIPEPGTVALFSVMAVALVWMRRRR